MAMERRKGAEALASFVTGATFGTVFGALVAAKPVKGAEPETKLDYLISLTEAIGLALAQIHQAQLEQIKALKDILVALGGAPAAPGVEVTVKTKWVGKEPVQLLNQAIRSAGTIFTDSMVNWIQGKRLLIKAESSLNQPITLQPIGNITDTNVLATDIGPPVPCAANGNASIGFAWDDWQPYVGVRITLGVAPTDGILTIWGVVQE